MTRSVVTLMLIGFGSQFGFFAFQPTFVLWAEKTIFSYLDSAHVQQAVGFVLTGVGFFGVLTQFFWFGPLVKRFGEKSMIVAGSASRFIAFGVMALIPLLVPSILIFPLISIGGGISLPALVALLTYVTPAERRGQAIGLLQSAQNIGAIFGPIIAGYLFDNYSPVAPMAFAASLMGLTAIIGAVTLSRIEVERPPQTVSA